MRDGNLYSRHFNLRNICVVSLPMRDGNNEVSSLGTEAEAVVSLPMRDGNTDFVRCGHWEGLSC